MQAAGDDEVVALDELRPAHLAGLVVVVPGLDGLAVRQGDEVVAEALEVVGHGVEVRHHLPHGFLPVPEMVAVTRQLDHRVSAEQTGDRICIGVLAGAGVAGDADDEGLTAEPEKVVAANGLAPDPKGQHDADGHHARQQQRASVRAQLVAQVQGLVDVELFAAGQAQRGVDQGAQHVQAREGRREGDGHAPARRLVEHQEWDAPDEPAWRGGCHQDDHQEGEAGNALEELEVQAPYPPCVIEHEQVDERNDVDGGVVA